MSETLSSKISSNFFISSIIFLIFKIWGKRENCFIYFMNILAYNLSFLMEGFNNNVDYGSDLSFLICVCMNFFLILSFSPLTSFLLFFVLFACYGLVLRIQWVLNVCSLRVKYQKVIWRQVFSMLGFIAGWPGWDIWLGNL